MHQRIVRDDDVRGSGRLAVQWRRHADLTAADHARWADLSIAAGAANIFAQHWFMDAALRHSGAAHDVRLAIVSGEDGAWQGVLPLAQETLFGRWPVANWQSWSATNQFLGAPLVRPGAAPRFWHALLCHLDDRPGREMLLHCQEFARDDPACAALIAYCRTSGRGLRMFGRFDRPAHMPDGDAAPDGKKQARLRALRRKLERDHGPASVEMLEMDGDPADWIDGFLALEKSGWKGREGSALACAPETEGLFRDVIIRGLQHGQARLATLMVGGRAVAMSSWFVHGDHGAGFKMAYDEGLRSYAPGLLLMRDVAERAGRNPAMLFDTCAPTAGGCGQPLWNGRRTIFDCAVAIGPPRRRWLFGGLMQARAAYAAIRSAMRRTASPA